MPDEIAAAEIKTPVLDNIGMIAKVRQWYRDSEDNWRDFRGDAEESYEFYSGDQWDDADKAKLNRQKRHALTFNKIFPAVNAVTGFQRSNRMDIKTFPRGGEDAAVADVMASLLRYTRDRINGEYEISNAFFETCITGISWIKSFIDYDDDPDGDPAYVFVPYDEIYPGPFKRADAADMKRMQHVKWMDLEDIRAFFPKAPEEFFGAAAEIVNRDTKKSFDSTPGGLYKDSDSHTWADINKGKVQVIETWWKEKKPYVLQTPSGKWAERLVDIVYFVVTCGPYVLQKRAPSPFQHTYLPFIPVYGFKGPEAPFGIVEPLKDPQREKNKRRSQLLNNINRMITHTIIAPDNSVDKREWEENASRPGAILSYKQGFGNKPEILQGQSPPAAIFQMEQTSDTDMKDIPGVNNAILGVAEGSREPGVAIQARQQQGINQLVTLFDNLRLSHKMLGRHLVKLIQQLYPMEKVMRIVGTSPGTIISQNPDAEAVLTDAMLAVFDIVVEEVRSEITSRQESFKQFEVAFDLIGKADPAMASQMIEFYIEQSDISNKGAIVDWMREYKQQQQQMMQAQQQQQMQMQQMEMEMKHQQMMTPQMQMQMQREQMQQQGQNQEFDNQLATLQFMQKEREMRNKLEEAKLKAKQQNRPLRKEASR